MLASAEEQWLAQITSMREALAELKLSSGFQNGETVEYGYDIALDIESISPSSDSDDLWDVDYEFEEYKTDGYESNVIDSPKPDASSKGAEFNLAWLNKKCVDLAKRSHALDAKELREHILAVLRSDSSGTLCRLC